MQTHIHTHKRKFRKNKHKLHHQTYDSAGAEAAHVLNEAVSRCGSDTTEPGTRTGQDHANRTEKNSLFNNKTNLLLGLLITN